ncbi:MAG: methyltransferase domain-containing protein [Fibrobacteraceae bacterium]
MDIGPHFLTILLKERIPAASIDSLGFWLDGIGLESVVEKHYPFDLANIAKGEFPEIEHTYDLITMAKVFEHLYVSPRLVLSSLLKILKPDGMLLLTAPNGVAPILLKFPKKT